MGIFNDPKRLAKLLMCFKVHESARPLSPIAVAEWLKEAEDELGNAQDVMKRVGIEKFMWDGFRTLLSIHGEFKDQVKWGASNPRTMQIGMSAARVIGTFKPEDQNILIGSMWDYGTPFGYEELRRIKACYTSESLTLPEAIKKIMKSDRIQRTVIFMFISGLDESIRDNLSRESDKRGIPLNDLTKQILSEHLPENSITSVKILQNAIRIVFTENGKKEFDKLIKSESINKNDMVNHMLKAGGF